MDVGRLIECVRKHVFLYDISHKDYKNPTLKSQTWEYIGRELNEYGETCKLKWKTVRDGYIKYKRQLKTRNREMIDYIWSSKLKFLDNHNVTRRSFYKSSGLKPGVILSEPDPLQAPQLQTQDDLTSMLSLSPPPLVPLGSSNDFAGGTSIACQSNKDIKNNTEDNRTNWWNIDATDHLFLSYSETFKTFTPRQQAHLKIALAKLFANAELEKLDNADRANIEEEDSPVIIKTECNERRNSESEMSVPRL